MLVVVVVACVVACGWWLVVDVDGAGGWWCVCVCVCVGMLPASTWLSHILDGHSPQQWRPLRKCAQRHPLYRTMLQPGFPCSFCKTSTGFIVSKQLGAGQDPKTAPSSSTRSAMLRCPYRHHRQFHSHRHPRDGRASRPRFCGCSPIHVSASWAAIKRSNILFTIKQDQLKPKASPPTHNKQQEFMHPEEHQNQNRRQSLFFNHTFYGTMVSLIPPDPRGIALALYHSGPRRRSRANSRVPNVDYIKLPTRNFRCRNSFGASANDPQRYSSTNRGEIPVPPSCGLYTK